MAGDIAMEVEHVGDIHPPVAVAQPLAAPHSGSPSPPPELPSYEPDETLPEDDEGEEPAGEGEAEDGPEGAEEEESSESESDESDDDNFFTSYRPRTAGLPPDPFKIVVEHIEHKAMRNLAGPRARVSRSRPSWVSVHNSL